MKFSTCLLFSFLAVGAFAQARDTIYTDSVKNLVMKDAALASDRSLIMVDNNVYKGLLKDIDLKTIVSFKVLKSGDAKEIFGESARNGAIIFTTKNESFIRPNIPLGDKRRMQLNSDKKPLIVIDGFIYFGNYEDIDPKEILSNDSLGNPGATNIYGDRGKNGVLLITTFKEGKWYDQFHLGKFSLAYRIYLEANKNDDSGLVYVLDGVVLKGSSSEITKALHDQIEKVQAVDFKGDFSEKPDINTPKPMVTITTKQ